MVVSREDGMGWRKAGVLGGGSADVRDRWLAVVKFSCGQGWDGMG